MHTGKKAKKPYGAYKTWHDAVQAWFPGDNGKKRACGSYHIA